MGKEFEGRKEVEVAATPEEVWEAIATGAGIDSWFMGRNEVEPREGGVVRTAFGAYTPESTVAAWDPPRRFAHRTPTEEDGRFIAYEFLIEGRGQSSTVLRMTVSGFLPGDDWEDEYDAMRKGGDLFFRTLVEYLTHFRGRTAAPVTAFGPPIDDWAHAWAVLIQALGLPDLISEGDRVQATVPNLPFIDGTVYFVNTQTLGIRTEDALYRFIQGFRGPMIAAHHVFAPVDQRKAEQAWTSWLGDLYA